jgi:hypothetical protein
MTQDSHHPVIAARASLRAGSKARRTKSLTLLLSSLILIAAMARAEATDIRFERCKVLFKFDERANPHLLTTYQTMCAAVDDKTLGRLHDENIESRRNEGDFQVIMEPRE